MTRDFSAYTVQARDTIRTAMVKITANKCRVVVVLDGKTVVGTASDGDIRRAFLRDVLPIAPVEKIMNVGCRLSRERDPGKLREIVRAEKVTLLPVVNDQNELVDIVIAQEPFYEEGRSFQT